MWSFLTPLFGMGLFYAGYRLGRWEAGAEYRERARLWTTEG